MENALISWMAEFSGFEKGYGGTLTSGGSIANLISVVTARKAKSLSCENIPRSVVYLSSEAHHSVQKALRIAGLEECIIRYIPLDKEQRMIAIELDRQIKADLSKGLKPFMVVASLGTTNTGAVDPLEEMGRIASMNDIWFHLDGAYGGFFLLSPEMEHLKRSVAQADSFVLDPHKGMFLPYGLGAVIIKDKSMLLQAHHYLADYLQDRKEEEYDSPADLSPELTRHFRALRMWLPLQLHGSSAFRAAISEKFWLARYCYDQIRKIPCVEILSEPQLSVFSFRLAPPGKDPELSTKTLLDSIHKDGRVFVSSTRVNDKLVIRVAVLCFRTHKENIDLFLKVITELTCISTSEKA